MERYFIDLHCHTGASFDSLADPRGVVKAAIRSPSDVLISSPTMTVSPAGAASRARNAPSIRS